MYQVIRKTRGGKFETYWKGFSFHEAQRQKLRAVSDVLARDPEARFPRLRVNDERKSYAVLDTYLRPIVHVWINNGANRHQNKQERREWHVFGGTAESPMPLDPVGYHTKAEAEVHLMDRVVGWRCVKGNTARKVAETQYVLSSNYGKRFVAYLWVRPWSESP